MSYINHREINFLAYSLIITPLYVMEHSLAGLQLIINKVIINYHAYTNKRID